MPSENVTFYKKQRQNELTERIVSAAEERLGLTDGSIPADEPWRKRWIESTGGYAARLNLIENPPPPEQAFPPGWNQLSLTEKKLYLNVFPHPTVQFLTESAAYVNENLPWLAKGIGYVGKALGILDILAEGTERLLGTAVQYDLARQQGRVGEFMGELGAAWKAGSFYYDVSNTSLFALQPRVEEEDRVVIYHDMPGNQELANIRRGFLLGKTREEIHAELQQQLGPLAMRSAMQDAFGHILADPANIIFPKIIRIPSTLIANRGEILYRAGAYTDDVIDVARIAETAAFDALDAARAAGRPLDESAQLVQDAIRASEYLAELEGGALSPWEKFVVNITGGIPQSAEKAAEWVANGPKGLRKLIFPWNWFRLTPQSRAVETLERISINVQSIIGKQVGVDEAVDLLKTVIRGGTDNPRLAHIVASAQGRAVQSWLKGADGVVDDLYGFWTESVSRRSNLEAIARLLSEATEGEYDIHRVMGKLINGEHGEVWQDLARVLDAAPAENMEAYHTLLNALRQEGTLTDDLLRGYGVLFKDMPYDAGTFKLHLMGQLWEWSAKQAIAKYGVSAASWFTRAADALKSVESLIFLRLNPKYPIINFLNNEFTGIARGIWNFMGPEEIVALWERIGIIHPRLVQGIGMGGVGGIGIAEASEEVFQGLMKAYGNASGVISDAAQLNRGWLGKISNTIKGIGLPADAGKLAQQVERSARMRFMTQGMLEGMNWYWRPGRGYSLLGDFDAQLAERIGDEVVNNLHNVIKVNPYNFSDKLTEGVALNRTVEHVFAEAADNLGIPAERITEVFGPEITERISQVLDPALQSGKADDVLSAVTTIRKDIALHIEDWLRGADPGELLADGPNGVLRVYGELQSQYWDMFEGHLKVLEERIPAIRAKDFEQLGPAWDALLTETDAPWRRMFSWRGRRIDALVTAMEEQGLAAIRFTDERTLAQVIRGAIDEETDVIRAFHRTRMTLFREHRRAQAAGRFANAGEEGAAWEAIRDTLRDDYANLITAQDAAQRTLDDAIELLVPRPQRDAFHNWRLVSRAARREYMEWNANFYEEARGLSSGGRAAYFQEQYQPIRSQYINDLHRMDRLGLQAMSGDPAAADELARMSRGILGQVNDNLRLMEPIERAPAILAGTGAGDEALIKQASRLVGERVEDIAGRQPYFRGTPGSGRIYRFDPDNLDDTLRANFEAIADVLGSQGHDSAADAMTNLVEALADDAGIANLFGPGIRAEQTAADALFAAKPRLVGGPTIDRPFFVDQNIIHRGQPPLAQTANSVYYSEGGTIIDAIQDSALDIASRKRFTLANLSDVDQAGVLRYIESVQSQAKGTQMAAMNYAAARADGALLNYTRRTELDQFVNTLAPYSFWPMHSMWNWALWSLERPAVLANYMRLRRLYETAAGDKQIPQRLRGYGMVPIKLPFWEDWMGEGVFVNPLRIGLPIETFTYPFERYYNNARNLERGTARALEEMLASGEIGQTEYATALRDRSGPIWRLAREKAKSEGDDDTWFDFASMLVSPHAPLMWAYRAAFKPDEPVIPSTLMPITRDIKSITGYLGVGPPQGINIEAGIRRALGLPEFDEWDDYRVDRMLSNMAATNEITSSEAVQAMILREGPLFEEAQRRAAKEYGARGAFGIVGIPLNIYPPGEERARASLDEFGTAIEAYQNGDTEAYKKFFDEHPEAKARLALFDSPEERHRRFLVDEMWSQYNEMPDLHKRQLREALGDDFGQIFLGGDPDTYSQVPIELFQYWLRAMNGEPVGTLSGNAIQVQYSNRDVAQRMQVFYDTRWNYFGNEIWDVQERYFRLERGSARRDYLAKHPELSLYWDWRKEFMYRNPDLAPYIEEDPEKWPRYPSVPELEQAFGQQPNFTPVEWQNALGFSAYNIALDALEGDLSRAAEDILEQRALQLGLTLEEMLIRMGQSHGMELEIP